MKISTRSTETLKLLWLANTSTFSCGNNRLFPFPFVLEIALPSYRVLALFYNLIKKNVFLICFDNIFDVFLDLFGCAKPPQYHWSWPKLWALWIRPCFTHTWQKTREPYWRALASRIESSKWLLRTYDYYVGWFESSKWLLRMYDYYVGWFESSKWLLRLYDY